MKAIILCVVALLMLALNSGATKPMSHDYHLPNAAFFFANNDDFYDVLTGVAETLCVQDSAVNDSPAAWVTAAAQCQDSRHDDEGTPLSDDGKWHNYVFQALEAIGQMCQGNHSGLCEGFR